MIEICGLNISSHGKTVLKDLNLTINDKETIGIIGSSGTGKSLILRAIARLVKPDKGKILLDGEELSDKRPDLQRKIGMVFQSFNLFSHLTIVENVMTGFTDIQRLPKREALLKSLELLKTVGLREFAYDVPHTLSGGQQQRAAIARTLSTSPEIILLDEPTSALDPISSCEVESVIRMLASTGHTMIIVSHQMELLRKVCSRVIFLNDGGIYEQGTPEDIFDNPKRTATRRFVRALRVLEFNVNSKDFDFIGNQTAISEFGYRNAVPRELIYRLESVMEEFYNMVIIQPKEENSMQVSIEYNNRENILSGKVYFTGPKVDPDDPMYFLSWPIIKMRCTTLDILESDIDKFTNCVLFTL